MPNSDDRSEQPSNNADINRYLHILSQLEPARVLPQSADITPVSPSYDTSGYYTIATAPAVAINDEIVREQKLKNDNVEQDIKLKRETLNRLFVFLALETGLIFGFAFCQAVHWPAHFHLEDWSFKLLVTVTIMQITGMLYVAVRYLFPKGK